MKTWGTPVVVEALIPSTKIRTSLSATRSAGLPTKLRRRAKKTSSWNELENFFEKAMIVDTRAFLPVANHNSQEEKEVTRGFSGDKVPN